MIPAQQSERALEVFWSAVDLPPDRRHDFVVEQCRAVSISEESVFKLLEAYTEAAHEPSRASVQEFVSWFEPEPEAEIPRTIGRYRVERHLGRGGMGAVYLATDPDSSRSVAIKILNPGLDARRALRRFQLESVLLARLRHPGIAEVYETGETSGGLFYMVLEYVDGLPLTRFCQEQRLSLPERLTLLEQVCEAVQHAHQRGVIHRDLKPANILVTGTRSAPRVKVIDFGLARLLELDGDQDPLATALGHVVGTFAYMSPEQEAARGDLDRRADVYSLGVILHELVTDELPDLSSREPMAPTGTELDWVIDQATQPDRDLRYPGCRELAEDLARTREGAPPLAGPQAWSNRWRRFRHRYRRLLMPVAATLVVLAAGTMVFTGLWITKRMALVDARETWKRESLARQDADQRTEEILRLSDRTRVQQLFSPVIADPGHEIQALEQRLAELDELVSRLPLHRQTLRELRERHRAQAIEGPPASSRRTQRRNELDKQMRLYQLALENTPSSADAADTVRGEAIRSRLAAMTEALERLEATVPPTRAVLDEETAQWHHDLLQELIEELEFLDDPTPIFDLALPTRGSLQARLTRSRQHAERFADARDAWDQAIRSIQDPSECPTYEGLQITPHPALVPLGRDPESGLWEFVHTASGAPPHRDPQGRIQVDATFGLVFVLLPGGRATVGAQSVDPTLPHYWENAQDNEGPVQEVQLDPFFIAKFEMTLGQWFRLLGRDPIADTGDRWLGNTKPALNVSWLDCQRFLPVAGLALPTEAQWEYACRGGTDSPWWNGDHDPVAAGVEHPIEIEPPRQIVGQLAANPFGLHDTLGNVLEWTREAGTFDYRSSFPREGDGLRIGTTTSPIRVCRGKTATFRMLYSRDRRGWNNGVRPILTLPEDLR